MEKPFTVLIDPGHGGQDPGACEIEAQVNLAVAKYLQASLNSVQIPAWLTRKSDTFIPLSDRCRTEWDLRPALFVSLHCNAATNPQAQGLEVWTSPGQTRSDLAATCLLKSLVSAFPEKKIRTDYSDGDGDKEGRFFVLTQTVGPAVLVEMGFLSNPEERSWLENGTNQLHMALALAAGILAWSGRDPG